MSPPPCPLPPAPVARHGLATPAPPARVVVLGGSGFIGRALTRLLDINGIDCLGLGSADLDLTATDAGVRLAGVLRADDALIFASAITRDRGRDLATLMKNLGMGQAVCEAIEARPCRHVVYLSSDAAYGDEAPNPLTEATPADPTDLYGVMHLARERMLEDVSRRCGAPLLVIRPTMVYGVGDTHGSYGPNRFLATATTEGRIVLFGEGEEVRDFIHVDDFVEFVSQALRHRTTGRLIVASGAPASFGDVAEVMRGLAGRKGPPCVTTIRIESAPRQQAIRHRVFDVSAMRALFPAFECRSLNAGLAGLFEREVV